MHKCAYEYNGHCYSNSKPGKLCDAKTPGLCPFFKLDTMKED